MPGALFARAARVAASLACLVLAGTGAALAHAVVLSSEPADGAVVSEAPPAVVIRFNEPVSLISAQVVDGTGQGVTTSEAAATEDMTVRIPLPAGLADGIYVASYRVVSLDSHPVAGSVMFSIGEPSAHDHAHAPAAAGATAGWRIALVALLALFYAGILGGAGGVLFLLMVRPPGKARAASARIAAALALVTVVAGALLIGIEGGYLLDAAPASFFSERVWRTGLASTLGRSAIAAIVGALLIAAVVLRPGVVASSVALVGAVLVLASFCLTGHVVTAGARAVTVPLLLVHTTAVAFWVGSLLPLALTLTRLRANAAPVVRRFSRIAVWSVAALVAAGIAIAAIQVESVPALVGTTYGRTLLLKVGLVAILLLLAALNKLRLTPRLETGKAGAVRALRASFVVEGLLAIAIIVVTAVLGTTPPPRAGSTGTSPATEEELYRPQSSGPALMVHASDRMVMLRFGSASAGANTLAIEFSDLDGMPIEAKEVAVSAENPAAGVGPIRRAASPRGNGRWQIDRLVLVPAGRWSIRVEVLVSDFEKAMFEAEVDLR